MYSHFIKLECMPSPLCHTSSVQEVLPGSCFSKVTKRYGTFEKIMGPRAQKTLDVLIGFCTLCFCFPTKMLHLNAPFFPLKCSVSPKKSLKCSDNAHYTYKKRASVASNNDNVYKFINTAKKTSCIRFFCEF